MCWKPEFWTLVNFRKLCPSDAGYLPIFSRPKKQAWIKIKITTSCIHRCSVTNLPSDWWLWFYDSFILSFIRYSDQKKIKNKKNKISSFSQNDPQLLNVKSPLFNLLGTQKNLLKKFCPRPDWSLEAFLASPHTASVLPRPPALDARALNHGFEPWWKSCLKTCGKYADHFRVS